MVPTGWLRFAGSKMGPIFLRVLLITVVSIYAVFGALVLSHLETQQHLDSSLFAPVYANRWNHSQNNIRHCITNVIKDLIGKNNCSNHAFDHLSLHHFKYCYHYNLLSNVTDNGQRDDSNVAAKKNSSVEAWPFIDSLLFAFALITTIGYGNITPKTFAGQMFCIFLLHSIDGSIASSEISDNDEQSNRTLTLFILFVIYVIAGSLLISTYEPEMPFLPRTYMAVTILYIIIGLALATIAIEIAADTLKKLHYFRRTIKHFGNIEIWFGGKRLTVRQIIRNFCDQFNVPDAALSGFTISNFVERAIKVEAGKLPPLRNQSFRRGTNFDEENEHLNEASALTESEAELEPAPEVTSQPKPTPEYESHPESCLSEFSSEREIPNVPEIPVLTLSEATLLREPSPIIEKLEPILKPELYRSELLEEENSIREEPPENTETLNRRGYSEEAWKRYQEYQNIQVLPDEDPLKLAKNQQQQNQRKTRALIINDDNGYIEACSVNADVAVRWETTETACSMKSFADTVASFALQSITIRKSEYGLHCMLQDCWQSARHR
ncbi:hypothetical protein DINM_021678 [Dirofilaria immitis]|nr:hypothetical protein [Dirofilaria immitis]